MVLGIKRRSTMLAVASTVKCLKTARECDFLFRTSNVLLVIQYLVLASTTAMHLAGIDSINSRKKLAGTASQASYTGGVEGLLASLVAILMEE